MVIGVSTQAATAADQRWAVADSLGYMPSVVDATETTIDLERPAREVVSGAVVHRSWSVRCGWSRDWSG